MYTLKRRLNLHGSIWATPEDEIFCSGTHASPLQGDFHGKACGYI